MNDETAAIVRELKDRQEIDACLHRYTRGIDRLDRELMLSAYHPDAIDDHGIVVLGAADFVDWAIGYHTEYNPIHHHCITNIVVDLNGDVAHSECYYTFFGTTPGGRTNLSIGRYVDRLEKRNGRWAIAARKCFSEGVHDIDVTALPPEYAAQLFSNGPQTRDRSDASYERPLVMDRKPVPA